jgi:hypothetical protein
MVRHFLLLNFPAASAATAENDSATRIAAIETRIGGRIGVAALDTSNSKHLFCRINSDCQRSSGSHRRGDKGCHRILVTKRDRERRSELDARISSMRNSQGALSLRHENINSESFREQRISYCSTSH